MAIDMKSPSWYIQPVLVGLALEPAKVKLSRKRAYKKDRVGCQPDVTIRRLHIHYYPLFFVFGRYEIISLAVMVIEAFLFLKARYAIL